MKKKLLVSLIAIVMVLSVVAVCFVGCGDQGTQDNTQTGPSDDELYTAALGDFKTALEAAKAKTDVDERFVAMAIAEAKLLESGTFLPTSSQGGRYAIGKVAPYTVSPTLWGTDSDRLFTSVVTTDYIKTADRDALKAIYAEVKGTGTYIARVKAYLAEHGYTLKDTYNMGYSEDPSTWDITNTYRSVDSEAIVNTYDGLLMYDVEGVAQPALAESWTVSDDGLTYTFNIRHGVKWVNKDGTEYADVKAQDWVYGMQRILDNGATSYLVEGILKNAVEYENGEAEFSEVGVKATDDYTLVYTLEAPCTYFLTMLNYNPFAPVCKTYVDATGEDYGTKPEMILYCGPYLVTNYTKDNKIVFSANPKYWNKDAINVQTINWISYAENEDVTATYTDMKAGTIDGASLNTTTVPMAKADNLFGTYAYVSGTDATTYGIFTNINRKAYSTNGIADANSSQSEAQKVVSKAALQNANFRMAFARGLDRAAYNAIAVGDDCKLFSLQNSYTPGTYVTLSKNVTTTINGTSKTFEAGTFYGEIVQAQLNADMGDKAMKVWDPEADGGIGSSSGFDGWFNEEVSAYYFDLAVAELAEQGIEVSKDNPIMIDYPIWGAYQIYANRAQALKQRVEKVFGGKVMLNIVSTSQKGWYYVGYYAETGAECNYDIYDCSGWGPDYGDPATYLNTMMPVNGDMIKMLGIY